MLLYCEKCKRETWHNKGECNICQRIEYNKNIQKFKKETLDDKLMIIYKKMLELEKGIK